MIEESREPGRERWPESRHISMAPDKNGSHAAANLSGEDDYALALEAIERLFLEQQSRIAEEMASAQAAAEESDFKDYRSISSAATRAARVSWEADDQIAGLKKRLDELYQERVVEPIMEIRKLSTKMEERNRSLFRRRVGDRL